MGLRLEKTTETKQLKHKEHLKKRSAALYTREILMKTRYHSYLTKRLNVGFFVVVLFF